MENQEKQTCKARVKGQLEGEIATLRKLWEMYKEDPEKYDEEDGNFEEHGLCFDYVAPGTFKRQRRGYFRYQISWGGPASEFRFFCTEGFDLQRVEFWFLDWFDGAKAILKGADYELLAEIFEDFKDGGTVQDQYNKATG